ncbi:hypothetical protein RJ55_04157 [Drechmeria coniospora]|nr:hypothetical protein RJ55_04157 [Drechmeria coniospora]
MATQFIGLHMSVVLRDPSGYRLTGTVRDVEAGSSLTLTNVYIDATKEHAAQMTINAANIADLTEVPLDNVLPAAAAAPEPVPVAVFPQPGPPQPAFVDPAILSMSKRPGSSTPTPAGMQYQLGEGTSPRVHVTRPEKLPEERRPEQDILDSIKGLTVGSGNKESRNGKAAETRDGPMQKRRARSRHAKQSNSQPGDRRVAAGSPAAAGSQSGYGKGWRETPILESTASFQPFSALKRQAKAKGKGGAPDNGWASEDVTEEMGDFDFENNLAKFDKRTIFDQMRKEDPIDESNRLVSHNRRPKPGTAGGKNLHYTENVLDATSTKVRGADFWNSEADVGANEEGKHSGRENRNGQGGARRADGKPVPSRRSQSRKASAALGSQPLSRVNSTHQMQPPGLYLSSSKRRLEAISTLQMLNLENIAANELGFSESLMAENAGRGIAEVAVSALDDPAIKVRFGLAGAGLSADTSLAGSVVVILAGNNKSGIRALAAGRHLRNKNMDVLVCLVGVERERDLLEDLRRQIQLYRNFGGKVLDKNDFFEHLRKSAASGAAVSVSLIVDALLGLTISFEELRVGDQATVYELMEWANRNEAFVLSVDVPTGIDPMTGKVAIIDGGQLYIKPRYVVAVGAPKRGLVEAVTPASEGDIGFGSTAHEDQWRLFLVDMGLGSAVWRKAGTKVRRGIDFDGKWVLEMRYRGAESDDGQEN